MTDIVTFYDFCVIGGGIAGISIAYRLSQLGKRVILLESQEEFGGRLKFAPFEEKPGKKISLGGAGNPNQPFFMISSRSQGRFPCSGSGKRAWNRV